MKTLERYDITGELGDYYGQPTAYCDKTQCTDGEYIKVDDLKAWLDWHVRNRTIHTIYSDLGYQIGE